MQKIHVGLFSFLLFLGGCQTQKKASSEDADLVIKNARVYTVDFATAVGAGGGGQGRPYRLGWE